MNQTITLSGTKFILRKAAITDVEVILHQRRKMYLDMGYQDDHALEADSGAEGDSPARHA